MRNRFQRIACALLLASILAVAAPGEDAHAAVVVNGRDDISNSCGKPTPMSGGALGDEINVAGDIDCYSFTTSASLLNLAVLVGGDLPVDCSVLVTDPSGLWYFFPDALPNKPNCSISWTAAGPRTYHVKVWGYDGFFDNQRVYYGSLKT